MIEVKGNLWTYPADVLVITTNGTVKKNGECVMGRGCAKEAKDKCSGWNLAKHLGDLITEKGNHVHFLYSIGQQDMVDVYSFPVKHKWMEKADIELIKRSAHELVHEMIGMPSDKGYLVSETTSVILLPRPGCGNGQLKWEDVKPVLEPILDDRFHVITF
jgi:hypothetical protein